MSDGDGKDTEGKGTERGRVLVEYDPRTRKTSSVVRPEGERPSPAKLSRKQRGGKKPRTRRGSLGGRRAAQRGNQPSIAPQTGPNVPYDEYALQYKKPGDHAECDVVIGLDFGTSATKVVIHAFNGPPGDPAWAVDFEKHAHSTMPQLIPSRLWCDGNGVCFLSDGESRRLVDDIKLEVIQGNQKLFSSHGPAAQGIPADQAAVAYLALVMRYVRQWFLLKFEGVFSDFRRLVWHLNLGVPSHCIEANEFHDRFRRIGEAAWMLSVIRDQMTLTDAAYELQLLIESQEAGWGDDPDELTCEFNLFPEVAAEAVGYAWSDARRPGLHLMMDVGASTLDVCAFILHEKEGRDCYSLLTSVVRQYGTLSIHHSRIEAMMDLYQKQVQALRDEHDPLSPISDDMERYIPSQELSLEQLKQADSHLAEECGDLLRRIVHFTKAKRYRLSPAWTNGLPIFLCGGGSQMPFYKVVAQVHCRWLSRFLINSGGRMIELPKPEGLQGEVAEYHRLAVAWGLSHPMLDIGDTIPSDQIGDDDPPPLHESDWEDRYISKDQV